MSEEKKKKTKKKKEVVEEQVVETHIVQEEVVSEQSIIEEVQPVAEVVVPSVFKVEGLNEAIKDAMTEELKKVVNLEALVEETINEELKDDVEEKPFRVNPIFTSEEKLYITKLVANGYRPFDIVKKARATLKLDEEKQKRLSLNIRTIEQLMKALEV